jgi:hypothetical protein
MQRNYWRKASSTNFVKDLETSYKLDLDQNLEASRKKDLTIITPFMQNEWQGFKQVSDDEMLQKVDTTFPKKEIDRNRRNDLQFTERQKVHQQNQKNSSTIEKPCSSKVTNSIGRWQNS